MNEQASQRSLTVFTLALMNVAIVASLQVLPLMATKGLESIVFFLAAALFFLMPSALVAAELETMWRSEGGVYTWVKEAFGSRLGFLAIWLQWIQNVIWFPTILSFAAATLAYVYDPALADNAIYMVVTILLLYWVTTFICFKGLQTSSRITSLGVIYGIIVPSLLIVILAVLWYFLGNPSQIQFATCPIVPDFTDITNSVFFAGILIIYAGMEVSAVHARNVQNPQRNFPRAIFLSALITILISVLGSLAISMVIPLDEISLVAGVMQAFSCFLVVLRVPWLIPLFALLVAFGAIAQLTSWIIGPSRGLLRAGKHGELPPLFQRENEHGVQVPILITQGIVVTLLSLLFVLMPSISSSYWILTALSVQLYLFMYVLMFAAGIRLRYLYPDMPRAYKVPFGIVGMWLVAGVGILVSLITIGIVFLPPSQLDVGDAIFYELFLIGGIILLGTMPFIIQYCKKPTWKQS